MEKSNECLVKDVSTTNESEQVIVYGDQDILSVPFQGDPFKTLIVADNSPSFHLVEKPFVSDNLMPSRLPEVFKSIPQVQNAYQSKTELDAAIKDKLRSFLKEINDEQFENLERYCSPENLLTDKSLKNPEPNLNFAEFQNNNKLIVDPSSEKKLLNVTKKFEARMALDPKKRYTTGLKYRGIKVSPLTNKHQKIISINTPEDTLTPGKDMIYRIRVYRPFNNALRNVGYNNTLLNTRNPLLTRDILLLGRSKLSILREKLSCVNDSELRIDVSDNPDQAVRVTCKELFPSGFLFINDVFYVDKKAGCHDISAPVREWAANAGLGQYPVRDMDITLDQMAIKLGHPEIYIHQGDCEHLFTFSEIRLLNASDPCSIHDYPKSTLTTRTNSIYCTTCAEYLSQWIVTECDKVPFDPAFFCKLCFKMYLYDEFGNKKTHFKAFRFQYKQADDDDDDDNDDNDDDGESHNDECDQNGQCSQ